MPRKPRVTKSDKEKMEFQKVLQAEQALGLVRYSTLLGLD